MRDSARQVERLQAIRLRYCINTHLEDQGITTPTAVGATTGLTAVEVVRLLTRRQWREGDVVALKVIAACRTSLSPWLGAGSAVRHLSPAAAYRRRSAAYGPRASGRRIRGSYGLSVG
jgi:hypothetical protein